MQNGDFFACCYFLHSDYIHKKIIQRQTSATFGELKNCNEVHRVFLLFQCAYVCMHARAEWNWRTAIIFIRCFYAFFLSAAAVFSRLRFFFLLMFVGFFFVLCKINEKFFHCINEEFNHRINGNFFFFLWLICECNFALCKKKNARDYNFN